MGGDITNLNARLTEFMEKKNTSIDSMILNIQKRLSRQSVEQSWRCLMLSLIEIYCTAWPLCLLVNTIRSIIELSGVFSAESRSCSLMVIIASHSAEINYVSHNKQNENERKCPPKPQTAISNGVALHTTWHFLSLAPIRTLRHILLSKLNRVVCIT